MGLRARIMFEYERMTKDVERRNVGVDGLMEESWRMS